MKLSNQKSYVRFWLASTVSSFGTYITTLALQVLVVVNLQGSTVDVGWINSSRWLPYVILGLVAGVFIDRFNRQTVLVLTDIGRGVLLSVICFLVVLDKISISSLMIIMVLFGAMSLFNDAASQSFVPQLVPRGLLMRAYARLEQSAAVSETSGPTVAGLLISWISAPYSILVNGILYVYSGLVMATIKHDPLQVQTSEKRMGKQIKEGLNWVYSHRYLRTLAFNTHIWFFFHSMLGTVLVTFALTELGFNASTLGLVLSAAGIGAVLGSTISTRVGDRWGIGSGMAFSRILYGPAVILMVLAPSSEQEVLLTSTFILIGLGQFFYGFALGIEGPLEMGYRQSITPARLHGRMNSTMRSINRSMVVIGAPLGGLIAEMFGFRTSLWITVAGLTFVGIWFIFSPMRNAQIEEDETE
ncbi:MFS transporter [Ornithinibacillus salinisoli]|uniref:MFS transporter n=1 Tax=Ornithinibacillus salinisoli TaxID=1848459 RepID=A0ABW4VTF2_9BACI